MTITTWKGGSGNFNTAGDWSQGVPGGADWGLINGAPASPIVVSVSSGASDLVGGLTLTDATLAVGGGSIIIGTIGTDDDTLASPISEFSVSGGSLTLQQGGVIIGGVGNSRIIGLSETGGVVVFQNGESANESLYLQGGAGGVEQTAGTIEVDAGTLQIYGNSNFQGDLTGATPGGGGTIDLRGGATYSFKAGVTLNVGAINVLDGGTHLLIDTSLTDSYAFVEGSGATIALGGNTLNLLGGGTLDGAIATAGRLDAYGQVQDGLMSLQGNVIFENKGFVSQSNDISLGDALADTPIIENDLGATYDIASGGIGLNGNGDVANNGLFEKTQAPATSRISALFSSTGTVASDSGVLYFTNQDSFAGTISGTGTVALGGGTAISLRSGLALTVASLVVQDNGTDLTIGGNLSDAGVFDQYASTTLSVASGATLTLSAAGDILNGLVTGAASSRLVLGTSAVMSDDGVTIGGAMTLADGGRIGQRGVVTVGATSGDTAVLQVNYGAVYDMVGPASIVGTGSVLNYGSFEATSAPGTSIVYTTFVNDGRVSATVGSIEFVNALVAGAGHTGTVTVSQGGTATFDNFVDTTQTVDFTDLTGHIRLTQTAGNIDFDGSIAGFGGTASQSDSIVLTNVTGVTASYSGTTTAGVLTLSQSGATVAQLHFTGDYTLASFVIAANAGGGTIITDPPSSTRLTASADAVAFSNVGSATETVSLAPPSHGAEQILGFSLAHSDVLDLTSVVAEASRHVDLINIGGFLTAHASGGGTMLYFDPSGHDQGSAIAVLDGVSVTIPALLSHHALSLG